MNSKLSQKIGIVTLVLILTGANFAYTQTQTQKYEAEIAGLNQVVETLQTKIDQSELGLTNVTSSEGTSVADLAAKVIPSVVGIEVSAEVMQNFGPWGKQTGVVNGTGSGIVQSSDGYIITNYHVIESYVESTGTRSITVVTSDGAKLDAQYVGGDADNDLAVLKVTANNLTAAEFDVTDDLRTGDFAMAIGYPLGMDLASSVTVGVISGIDRALSSQSGSLTLIQTDAAINPGNSGGALVNRFGQVIGINNSKIASTSVEGIGFSIPIYEAMPILQKIINNAKAS